MAEEEGRFFHELPPITQEEVDISQDQIMLYDFSEPDPAKKMKRISLSALKNALGIGAVVTPLGLAASSIPVTTIGGSNGSITLTASGGTAPYEYRVGSGSSFGSQRVGSATFNGYPAGPYTGEVRDAKGNIASVSVTVGQPGANAVPSANAGIDKTITLPTSSVQLSGSGSDSDGSIASYYWTQLSGPNTVAFSSKTVAQPTVSALILGTYQFQLVVTDNQGAVSVADSVTVQVNAAAAPLPTISSLNPSSGNVGSSVIITGTGFTGATNVRFNGMFSSFTVNSATSITATVPANATSGKITVETPNGNVSSTGNFTVTVPAPSFNRTLQMGATEGSDGVYLNAVPGLVVKYNAKTPVADSAAPSMALYFGSDQIGVLDFNVTYSGETVQFTYNGTTYTKTFINGNLTINA